MTRSPLTLSRIVQPSNSRLIPSERPAQICILGTSLTARGTWPDELALKLSAHHSAGVIVTRMALPGASSKWGLMQLRNSIAESNNFQPDAVVIEYTANDSSLYRGMSISQSYLTHQKILGLLKDCCIFLAVMNPAWGVKALVRPRQVAYHRLYLTISRDYTIGLIDTMREWQCLSRKERAELVPDGIHPTEEAMRRIALPAFEAALLPLISPGCREQN